MQAYFKLRNSVADSEKNYGGLMPPIVSVRVNSPPKRVEISFMYILISTNQILTLEKKMNICEYLKFVKLEEITDSNYYSHGII